MSKGKDRKGQSERTITRLNLTITALPIKAQNLAVLVRSIIFPQHAKIFNQQGKYTCTTIQRTLYKNFIASLTSQNLQSTREIHMH
ncbi:hypothetical protein CDL12_13708 [Handroanthus impetiginosus]|uniref:Uncharacterized protein n=1 Tax=Handroanthus impetiginosus TaxID=429701 RepID=A0A2G9H856_9LAMI|nr:hypothetical protein CDL12_13708 [Handroanthus impetiginosus]